MRAANVVADLAATLKRYPGRDPRPFLDAAVGRLRQLDPSLSYSGAVDVVEYHLGYGLNELGVPRPGQVT